MKRPKEKIFTNHLIQHIKAFGQYHNMSNGEALEWFTCLKYQSEDSADNELEAWRSEKTGSK